MDDYEVSVLSSIRSSVKSIKDLEKIKYSLPKMERSISHICDGRVYAIGSYPTLKYRHNTGETEPSTYFLKFLERSDSTVVHDLDPPDSLFSKEFRPPRLRDLVHHLEDYFTPVVYDVINLQSKLSKSFSRLKAEFGSVDERDPLNTRNLKDIIFPASTHPGIFYRKLGYRTKGDAHPVALRHATGLLQVIMDGSVNLNDIVTPPTIVGGRGKLVSTFSEDSEKEGRLILMPDLAYHLVASLVSQDFFELINSRRKGKRCISLGIGPFSGDFYDLAQRLSSFDNYLCFDFRRFDKKILSEVLRKSFDFVASFYPDTVAYRRYFDFCFENCVRTRVLLPNGSVYQKTRGIASGDPWTSIIGSVANWLMLSTLFQETGRDFYLETFGDDSIAGYNGPLLDIDWCERFLSRTFACDVNKDKIYNGPNLYTASDNPLKGTSAHYLSNYFYESPIGVVPVRPSEDILEKLLYPEKNLNTIEFEVARVSAMYLANYWNDDLEKLLRTYWDWIHNNYEIPELGVSDSAKDAIYWLSLPSSHFSPEFFNRLITPIEAIMWFKYGHRFFQPIPLMAIQPNVYVPEDMNFFKNLCISLMPIDGYPDNLSDL